MYVHRVKLVPVRHRRLSTFFVPDPTIPGAEPEEWNLETYRLMPVGTKIVRGVGPGGGPDRLAIKSERDGIPRMLPEAIAALWQGGEAPVEALPILWETYGAEFARPKDFEPVLTTSRGWRRLPWIALSLFLLALVPLAVLLFLQSSPKPPPSYEITTLERWLAAPVRPNILVSATGAAPALATERLPAGYRPPETFLRGLGEGPAYTLARIQAKDEQRLVLVSGYEHGLLPRVYATGVVVPTARLALPDATLAAIGTGARGLNPAFVLCNHASPEVPRGAVLRASLFTFAALGAFVLLILVMPLGILLAVRAARRSTRREQVRGLRRRLGLPENPPPPAVQ